MAAIISFKSYKSRRVTRSVLADEDITIANLFDEAFSLKKTVELALKRNVHLHLLTDSKSLFDIISKGSRMNEKRLMLDIHAAREGYKAYDIISKGFVRSEHKITDGLTKCMKQDS